MNNYAYCLNSLMLFINNTEYDEARAFSQEWLVAVANIHVYWYLANKAYSTPEPCGDDFPDRCRSATIKYQKKAISHFMPQWCRAGDEIQKEGNPTKSQAVNNLIKGIEWHEVNRGCNSGSLSH
jgi:hypothetical protein